VKDDGENESVDGVDENGRVIGQAGGKAQLARLGVVLGSLVLGAAPGGLC
jgi:hypothetical protein